MPEPRAVIFDLDDTLYPERQYVHSGYRAVAEHLVGPGPRADEMSNWLWKRFLTGQAGGAFDALNVQFELGLDSAGIARLVELYRTHRPDIRPRDGIGDLLDRLAAAGRKLGILSDGYLPAQQLKLDALGLAGRFGAVVFTEAMGREFWKPHPAGFQRIAELLAVAPEACAYVGDNPSKDFVAPNRLGWATFQLILDGQVHAQKPAPPGGRAGAIVTDVGELGRALGL
jgi:putative hydrolase of the HAD superfamily